MNNYILDIMTWSYSRINSYKSCPYQFYLKYIENLDSEEMFFSSYGKFIHELYADVHSGKITEKQALSKYIILFRSKVHGHAPTQKIFRDYYLSGMNCVENMTDFGKYGKILGIEEPVDFKIDGLSFVGYVDMILRDGDGVTILDHKSRDLKPRSKRALKANETLDEYLRQLYLYSIPVGVKFGTVSNLMFNCYRTGRIIKEPFNYSALDEAKRWAMDSIEEIYRENDWNPDVDYWRCKHLCGMAKHCEFAQMDIARG